LKNLILRGNKILKNFRTEKPRQMVLMTSPEVGWTTSKERTDSDASKEM